MPCESRRTICRSQVFFYYHVGRVELGSSGLAVCGLSPLNHFIGPVCFHSYSNKFKFLYFRNFLLLHSKDFFFSYDRDLAVTSVPLLIARIDSDDLDG